MRATRTESTPDPFPLDPVWGGAATAFVVAVTAVLLGGLLLGAGPGPRTEDVLVLVAASFGSGLASALLGLGSTRVVAVRWPTPLRVVSGVVAVGLLAVVARQVTSGAAGERAIDATGAVSLRFAWWALQVAAASASVAFLVGRAAGFRADR